MGANRDWAWAPIAVIIGLLAVAAAAGVGSRSSFEVIQRERLPLLALIACFLLFILFGLIQMATWAPLSGSAWFYETAARLLGSAHAPVPDLAIDASRNTLLKCLTCGAIFLMARALCRDRARAAAADDVHRRRPAGARLRLSHAASEQFLLRRQLSQEGRRLSASRRMP